MNRGPKPEPLEGHPRYEKVRARARACGEASPSLPPLTEARGRASAPPLAHQSTRQSPAPPPTLPPRPHTPTQIRDLNSGTFGFVQLARDKQSGEYVAIKFIERGDKVRRLEAAAAAAGSAGTRRRPTARANVRARPAAPFARASCAAQTRAHAPLSLAVSAHAPPRPPAPG